MLCRDLCFLTSTYLLDRVLTEGLKQFCLKILATEDLVKLCMRDINALSPFIDDNLQFKNGSQTRLFQSLEDIAGLK